MCLPIMELFFYTAGNFFNKERCKIISLLPLPSTGNMRQFPSELLNSVLLILPQRCSSPSLGVLQGMRGSWLGGTTPKGVTGDLPNDAVKRAPSSLGVQTLHLPLRSQQRTQLQPPMLLIFHGNCLPHCFCFCNCVWLPLGRQPYYNQAIHS